MANLHAWAAHMSACGLSASTVTVRCHVIAAMARWSQRDPAELTPALVAAYLAGHALKPWSRRKYLEHVRAYGEWLGRDLIGELRPPRVPPGVPRPVSESDLERLLAVASGEVRSWVLLGAYLGLRSMESAKVAGADLEDGRRLRVVGKGGRTDLLPVPPIVALDLARWVTTAGAGRLWPGADARRVQLAIRRLGARVGVDVTSHQLRHRYGTQLFVASGGNLLLTQRLMRHSSPATQPATSSWPTRRCSS